MNETMVVVVAVAVCREVCGFEIHFGGKTKTILEESKKKKKNQGRAIDFWPEAMG